MCLKWPAFNGNYCVDTFLDLEKFYDSTDNVKLIQASEPTQMGSPLFCACLCLHICRLEDQVICGEIRSNRAIPFSNALRLFQFVGWSPYCTTCYKTSTPFSQCKSVSKWTVSIITATARFSSHSIGQSK